jgi:hypothetical protein
VCVEGAGLGYLGRHVPAVASRLDGFTPEVYALRDGLLYRAWLREDWRLSPARLAEEPIVAERMASYVVARTRALAAEDDTSQRLVRREAAWEVAATLLAAPFGRARALLGPVTGCAARRLLVARTPTIVDGSMALSNWFAPPFRSDEARKVEFAVRAFSNEDRYCYDPIFDLAGAAAGAAVDPLCEGRPDEIRQAYEELTGEAVPRERWLLYQLLHHWRTHDECISEFRDGRGSESAFCRLAASERMMSSACRDYLRESFPDQSPPRSGPLAGSTSTGFSRRGGSSFPRPRRRGCLPSEP